MARWKAFAALLSVAFGVATQLHLNSVSGPYLQPTINRCQAERPKILGVPGLDDFLCFIVPFFKDALSTRVGYFATASVTQLGSVWSLLGAFEASRLGSGRLLSAYWLFLSLGQVLGISVVVPLLWIPAYLFYSPKLVTPNSTAVSPGRVWAITIISYASLFVFAAPFILEGHLQEQVLYWYQVVPFAMTFLWLPFQTTSRTDLVAGHESIITAYWLAMGTSFFWHVYTVLSFIQHPSLPHELLDLLTNHPGKLTAAHVLWIDAVVLWVALVYFVLIESGVLDALFFLVASALVSPGGGFALYLINREKRLLEAARVSIALNKKGV